jgi:hypothetical protein
MSGTAFTLNRYETWELDAMLEQIERPNPWLLNTFFNRTKMFTTPTIEFDLIDRGRRMAPFVSPLVAGKPMRLEGMRTRSLAPAYVKPTAMLVPQQSYVRRPGEGYGGTKTPQQRFDELVAETLALHTDMVNNRLEWMAAQALVFGAVTISGEEYQTVLVDFGRDPSLTLNLSGLPTAWDQVAATPMEDIETMALKVRQISKGAVVTDLVMSGTTWQLIRFHSNINDLISAFFRRGNSEVDAAPRTDMNVAQLVGNLNGRLNLWVYDAYVQDDAGNDQPLIPDYNLLGLSHQIEGTQYYGAILDLDAQMQARTLFSKSEKKFNPSALELVSQSAPLAAPKRPNAMFRIICK